MSLSRPRALTVTLTARQRSTRRRDASPVTRQRPPVASFQPTRHRLKDGHVKSIYIDNESCRLYSSQCRTLVRHWLLYYLHCASINYLQTCLRVCVRVQMPACVLACMLVCVRACACACASMHACAHVCSCACTNA